MFNVFMNRRESPIYKDAEDLILKLAIKDKITATRDLVKFYVKARFGIDSEEEFEKHYTDGPDDGGIDFYYIDGLSYYIIQSKFSSNPKNVDPDEINHEIGKLKNTLNSFNPNKRAFEFVNSLKEKAKCSDATLELIWLTTNYVKESVRREIQKDLMSWKEDVGWLMAMDFVAVDKDYLEGLIYDYNHGYIPYTGKKTLKLKEGQWMEKNDQNGVFSVICIVDVNDILKWFSSPDDVDKYLQKNVREFLGESSKINKAIKTSYLEYPEWFWYKHNGIIMFADDVYLDKGKMELHMRNPQVVNGGQTLKSLFLAYRRNNKKDNCSEVLLRVYKLPYKNKETYNRSIEIIAALNSQNNIKSSDLKSTDSRQVRIEILMKTIGSGYRYIRKRSKDERAGPKNIRMQDLALRYYVCIENVPYEGVRGNVEELFSEENKYKRVFDENAINKELSNNHVVIRYITCWVIDRIIRNLKRDLPPKDSEYFKYTKWFVLWDVYRKLMDWKEKRFYSVWQHWIDFLDSSHFRNAIAKYGLKVFRIGREIIPKYEEPLSFFKTKKALEEFKPKVDRKENIRYFEKLMNKALKAFNKDNP